MVFTKSLTMHTKLHHLFFLKKNKKHQRKPLSIYLRITIAGKRAELSTGKSIERSSWMPKTGRAKGSSKNAKRLNNDLNLIESNLLEAYHSMIRRSETITSVSLKNNYLGVEEDPRMLVGIFQQHNRRMADLVPNEFAAGTLERYKTCLSHTVEFMKWKYGAADMNTLRIDHDFIAEFDFFLRHIRRCSNNTTVKYLRNFRKIIRLCIANGWLKKDPFAMYRAKMVQTQRVFLHEEELRALMNKEFSIARLIRVRDIFLFCCFTGLAYTDVHKIGPQNVFTDEGNRPWIAVNRTKTATPSNVPLLPAALKIIEKYQEHPYFKAKNRLLPVLSNQKMNSYLKEIADCCGIRKELTFHTARHTFATTVTLNNHVPIESVSKMLGHRNISDTQHYAKLLDKKILHDIEPLFLKY